MWSEGKAVNDSHNDYHATYLKFTHTALKIVKPETSEMHLSTSFISSETLFAEVKSMHDS